MSWELAISIDRGSADSLTAQVQAAIREGIDNLHLHPRTRLPSTRQLALDLGVSRSVIVEAYEQLTAEGYLESMPGSGTTVASRQHLSRQHEIATSPVHAMRWDLRAVGPSAFDFPRAEWAACYQEAVAEAAISDLGYPEVCGVKGLRAALAARVGRVRRVLASVDSVMVTAGFAQALALVCRALPQLGIGSIAVEDPCHPAQLNFIADHGMGLLPIRVDEQGILVEELRASGARAVVVTPAHQFPTGHVMSAARRAELLAWAQDVDGYIIEDDYDGEFWLGPSDETPMSLQGELPERVIYAGTASKSLVPALRLGWIVMPSALREPLIQVRGLADQGSDALTQLAFARLISTGMLDRHLRRCRSRYRSRREALSEALALHMPGATIVGAPAGLHTTVRLPAWVDERALTAAAAQWSIMLKGARDYQCTPGRRAPALVIGYAALPFSAIGDSTRALGEVMREQLAEQRRRAVGPSDTTRPGGSAVARPGGSAVARPATVSHPGSVTHRARQPVSATV